jgi:hypothetical protein
MAYSPTDGAIIGGDVRRHDVDHMSRKHRHPAVGRRQLPLAWSRGTH